MHAVLLASATETTLTGFFSNRSFNQNASGVSLFLQWRMTAVSPITRRRLRYRSPCLDIPPKRTLSPLEFCFGTRPGQAANCRPERNCPGSLAVATIAVAVITPTPGMATSLRLASFSRCHSSNFWLSACISSSSSNRRRTSVFGAICAISGNPASSSFSTKI